MPENRKTKHRVEQASREAGRFGRMPAASQGPADGDGIKSAALDREIRHALLLDVSGRFCPADRLPRQVLQAFPHDKW